jgi:hypothetical protein
MENGISASQRMKIDKLAGPWSTGLFENKRRIEAIPNRKACRTGAAILALGNFRTQ